MTEEELKIKLDESFKSVKPIVEQVTHLIMDAYEKGFDSGLEVGKALTYETGKV